MGSEWSVGSLTRSQGGVLAGSGTRHNCFACALLLAELEIRQLKPGHESLCFPIKRKGAESVALTFKV